MPAKVVGRAVVQRHERSVADRIACVPRMDSNTIDMRAEAVPVIAGVASGALEAQATLASGTVAWVGASPGGIAIHVGSAARTLEYVGHRYDNRYGGTGVNADDADAQRENRFCCAITLRAALTDSMRLLAEIRSDIEACADPVARINLALARLHQRLRDSGG